MGHQIFHQLNFSYGKSGKSCNSRPNWKPVTLETIAKPQNKEKKDPKQETSQSLERFFQKKVR